MSKKKLSILNDFVHLMKAEIIFDSNYFCSGQHHKVYCPQIYSKVAQIYNINYYEIKVFRSSVNNIFIREFYRNLTQQLSISTSSVSSYIIILYKYTTTQHAQYSTPFLLMYDAWICPIPTVLICLYSVRLADNSGSIIFMACSCPVTLLCLVHYFYEYYNYCCFLW